LGLKDEDKDLRSRTRTRTQLFVLEAPRGRGQVLEETSLDIKRRNNNVVLHGLHVPEGADADSRYAADNDQIMELFHEMGCDDVSVDSVIRLGKKLKDEQAKSRPLLLHMASEEQKDKILRHSQNLLWLVTN